MTLEQAVRALQNLPAEKQEVVTRLIQILAGPEKKAGRAPIPSWLGILKGSGPSPSLEDCREARRECWNFDRKSGLL